MLKELGFLALVALLIRVARLAFRTWQGLQNLPACPGRYLFWCHPFSTVGLIVAPFFPPKGWLGYYSGRFSSYAKEGCTILGGLYVWSSTPTYWIADPQALKAITSDRLLFVKDLSSYEQVTVFGSNVVLAEGNEWRRHIAIAGPAFSEANLALTWSESLRVVQGWFSDEMDNADKSQKVDVIAKLTQVTLHIIAAAGFGMCLTWSEFSHSRKASVKEEASKLLPFHDSIQTSIKKLFVPVLVPSFFKSLPFRVPWVSDQLDIFDKAFTSLQVHIHNLATTARHDHDHDSNNSDVKADLLRRLVKANEMEKGSCESLSLKGTLTDEELFGNIFMFLLAGHETSSHTLSFAIMLLAVYPEVQKKLREESLRIWPTLDDMNTSTFKRDFDAFEYTLAFFRETLRCFPVEPRLIKLAASDTVLHGTRFSPSSGSSVKVPASSFDGADTNLEYESGGFTEETYPVTIPKGSIIMLDVWGLQMNPLVWGTDAHMFKPEHFIDTDTYTWPRDGFLAFSAGPRGCIGHRFAATESVCVLASLVRSYEVLPVEELSKFKSFEDYKRYLLKWTAALTIAPANAFVKLRPH